MAYEEMTKHADKIFRIEIREITEKGVKEAFEQAIPFSKSNRGLYDAFLARRIGDRIVGYTLSPEASYDMRGKFSVGRVQSPAVRLVVEKEREIRNFKPEPYWRIYAWLAHQKKTLVAQHTKDRFKKKETADRVWEKVKAAKEAVTTKVTQKKVQQHPKAPFTTANLQATANAQLRMAPERAMKLAQGLFERGLITYHRTDSVRINPEFIAEIRAFVKDTYGKEYIPAKPKIHKSKNTQADAHEGIRPTKLHTLEQLAGIIQGEGLEADHQKLYELIFKRAVSSQMSSAVFDSTRLDFDINGEPFKATGRVMRFAGCLVLYQETEEKDEGDEPETAEPGNQQELPPLNKGDVLVKKKEQLEEKTTKPPPRFSEGRLVKELEKLGIGRPSTYASIMRTLKNRDYVRKEKGKLLATSKAERLVDYLASHHGWIIDYNMTRNMEEYLDKVESENADWHEVVRQMHTRIKEKLAEKSPPPTGPVDPTHPSQKQIDYAQDLAAKLKEEFPEELLTDRKGISQFIKKCRKEVLNITPLSVKQMAIITKHAESALADQVENGDYAAGRKFINDFFKGR